MAQPARMASGVPPPTGGLRSFGTAWGTLFYREQSVKRNVCVFRLDPMQAIMVPKNRKFLRVGLKWPRNGTFWHRLALFGTVLGRKKLFSGRSDVLEGRRPWSRCRFGFMFMMGLKHRGLDNRCPSSEKSEIFFRGGK